MRTSSWSLMVVALAGCAAGQGELVPRSPRWKAELIAEAPTVRYPSIVACAPDGRVFWGEDPMDIVTGADKALGRVLCLHPDGKVTVFAEKLYAPFGMLYLDGKLYVHHSPRFSLIVDDNGLGKDRVDLIECTNPNPWALDWNDHVPANIRLAMDGYLYMSVGDKGIYGAVGRDGKPAELHGGGILRLRPDATGLEVFCRGTRNHLDVMINDEDDIFTYDNTDERDWWSRLAHMVDGGYYGYPWDHKPPQPHILRAMADFGAGAATATVAYNEDALPEEYRGNLFLADFGKAQVLRVRVARDGATYRVISREDFFAQVPDSFRPVGLALAPDGVSFYIGDWQHRDVKVTEKKPVVGRLWKVTYTGRSQAVPRPDWYLPAATGKRVEAPTAELIRGLFHPAHSVRLVAQRRLAERGGDAIELLIALLADRSAPAQARWHALWTLDAMDGGAGARKTILSLSKDPEVSVRRQALRQLGTRRVREAVTPCVALLQDADASLRFQAATALGRIGDPAAVAALLEALDDEDSFARYAAVTAINRIGRAEPAAWQQIVKGLESGRPAVRQGTLLAMRETYELPVVSALAKATRASTLLPETRAAALELLAQLHKREIAWRGEWWAYHPVNLPRPAKTRDWEGTADALAALRAGVADAQSCVRRAGIDALHAAGDVQMAPKLRALFHEETDIEVRGSILRALAAFKDTAADELVAAVLHDRANPSSLVLEAIDTAHAIGDQASLVRFLRSSPEDPQVLAAVIRVLGKQQAAAAFPLLVNHLNHGERLVRTTSIEALGQWGGAPAVDALLPLIGDPEVEIRRSAIAALGELKHEKAVPALNKAFGQEETRFEAATALARVPDIRALDAYLYGLSTANETLRRNSREAMRAIAASALPLVESRLDTGLLNDQVIQELRQVYDESKSMKLFEVKVTQLAPTAYLEFAMKGAGDPARGRRLFFDSKGIACAKCHRVNNEGEEVGPDLSGVGAQYARKDLAESILFPSKVIREGFQALVVVKKQGQIVIGLARGETGGKLTLQDAEGRTHVIAQMEIEERKASDVSLMPDGLHTGLSLDDFADIVSFLESLQKKPEP